MRNFILILFAGMIFCCSIQAQITAFDGTAFSFIAKDASGQAITNQTANVIIRLRANSATGAPFYEENNSMSIPIDGVVSGVIGEGTATIGVFSSIDWTAQDVYLELVLNGVAQGTMKFYAVPYAQYAKVADVATSVVNKEIVVVNQANHQTVVVNDNDIVKIDGVINLGTTSLNLFSSKNGLSIMGGSFEATSSSNPQISFGPYNTITGVKFKNINISGTTFINCSFEDATINTSSQFTNCTFTGSNLNLANQSIISGGIIGSYLTLLTISFGNECTVNNARIQVVTVNPTDKLSLNNNEIKHSRFNRVDKVSGNVITNSRFLVEHVFVANECTMVYVKNANTSQFAGYSHNLTITGNQFSQVNNLSSTQTIIEIDCFNNNTIPEVIIANNTFETSASTQRPIDITGNRASGSNIFMHILIDGNMFFTYSNNIINYTASGRTRTIMTNNISTNNPSASWGLPSGVNNIIRSSNYIF